jgi:hypothetical protein
MQVKPVHLCDSFVKTDVVLLTCNAFLPKKKMNTKEPFVYKMFFFLAIDYNSIVCTRSIYTYRVYALHTR